MTDSEISVNVTWGNDTHTATLSTSPGYILAGLWLTVTSVLAVVAEVVVWLAVLKTAKLKNTSNYVVLNLSLADLLVDVFNVPVVISSLLGGFVPSARACQVIGMLNMSTFVGTVLCLVLISVNRYFAVCHPSLYSDVFRPCYTAAYVTLCWSITLTVSAMPFFGWSIYHFESSQRLCFADWSASVSYAVFMVTLCFCIPALVLMTTNFLIFRQMRQSKNKIRQFENNSTGGNSGDNASKNRHRRDEFRLAKSMLIIILCFFFSWVTFAFCAFAGSFRLLAIPGWLSMTSLVLGYSNSCLNPFIYGLMNTNVRNAIISLLPERCRRPN